MHDYVISDTHFFHKNIVEYSGRPQNHNELMIANWLRWVKPGDSVLHLGDVLMGPKQDWGRLTPALAYNNAGNVFVLNSGNHDEPHKRQWIEEKLGWLFIEEFVSRYRGYDIYFTHRPKWTFDPDSFEVQADHRRIPSSSINVHGHIHEKSAPSIYHINVSVEQIDYKPVNLMQLLDKRLFLLDNR